MHSVKFFYLLKQSLLNDEYFGCKEKEFTAQNRRLFSVRCTKWRYSTTHTQYTHTHTRKITMRKVYFGCDCYNSGCPLRRLHRRHRCWPTHFAMREVSLVNSVESLLKKWKSKRLQLAQNRRECNKSKRITTLAINRNWLVLLPRQNFVPKSFFAWQKG